ncbi:MAG: hypothetical protein ACTSRG_27065 [Candidatus Helarchaeota archaeon]
MKITITEDLKNENLLQCQKIRSILDNRIIKFFKKETNILKTSDLHFKYVK